MSHKHNGPRPFNPPKPEKVGQTHIAKEISEMESKSTDTQQAALAGTTQEEPISKKSKYGKYKTRQAWVDAKRNSRVPAGQAPDKMHVRNKDPNLVYRITNDDFGGRRIRERLDRGYDFVDQNGAVIFGQEGQNLNTDLGSGYSQHVGFDYENKPMRGYLMAIPKELYDEDQRLKQKKDDALMEQVDPNRQSPSIYYGNSRKEDRPIEYGGDLKIHDGSRKPIENINEE